MKNRCGQGRRRQDLDWPRPVGDDHAVVDAEEISGAPERQGLFGRGVCSGDARAAGFDQRGDLSAAADQPHDADLDVAPLPHGAEVLEQRRFAQTNLPSLGMGFGVRREDGRQRRRRATGEDVVGGVIERLDELLAVRVERFRRRHNGDSRSRGEERSEIDGHERSRCQQRDDECGSEDVAHAGSPPRRIRHEYPLKVENQRPAAMTGICHLRGQE